LFYYQSPASFYQIKISMEENNFDVIVLGAGPAGLSAGIYLG